MYVCIYIKGLGFRKLVLIGFNETLQQPVVCHLADPLHVIELRVKEVLRFFGLPETFQIEYRGRVSRNTIAMRSMRCKVACKPDAS